MARYEPEVVQLNKKSIDALNSLAKAVQEQNRPMMRAERRELQARRLAEPEEQLDGHEIRARLAEEAS